MAERYRNYRVQLYADNPAHIRTLKKIQRSPDLKLYYCGIWHTLRDSGNEIIKGSGKKHCHIIFSFPNGRSYPRLCNLLFENPDDFRFIGRIGYDEKTGKKIKKDTLEGAFVYLPHLNAPDKEPYNISDIFGALR